MEPVSLEIVIQTCKPPKDIQSFSPTDDVLYHGTGKKQQRNIFYHQKFTDRELEKLRRLKEMITKQKFKISHDWNDSELLKFVYGANFKTKSAFKALKACVESRNEVLTDNFLLLYRKLVEILKTGPLYFHGRDCHFRPLLVMNFSKFDLKRFSFDLYLQAACFMLEFAARYMLLPGKVENWLCISDLGFRGFTDLPLNTMRKITKVLQDIFKCRMAYSTMVNVPSTIYFIYSCLKPFLDQATIEKITIEKGGIPTNIIHFFNPLQVEERYGGKARNLEVFWPPFFPNAPVSLGGHVEDSSSSSEIVEDFLNIPKEQFVVKSEEVFVYSKSDDVNEEEAKENEKKDKRKKRKKKRNKNKNKNKRKDSEGIYIETHSEHVPADLVLEEDTDEIVEKFLKKPSNESLMNEVEEVKENVEIFIDDEKNSTFCSWELRKCFIQ